MKKLLVVVIFFFATQFSLFADIPYIVNFKQILNQSDAGKKAQSFLKNKLESGIKNLQDKEKKILEEEKKLIQQKKLISNED